MTIFNPRRKDFDINSIDVEEIQIVWEFKHLRDADIIVFWFPKGGLCQITLYELGRWGNSSTRPIIIGVEPGFSRIRDIKYQTMLSRQDVTIYDDFEDFVDRSFRLCETEYRKKKSERRI